MRQILFSTLAAILLSGVSFAQNANIVRLSGDVSVASSTVKLGDIAEISGTDAEKLSRISLGNSPSAGTVREILRERVRLAIAAAGFSAQQIDLQMPERFTIRRRAQEISKEELLKRVETVVIEQLKRDGVETVIVDISVPDGVNLPSGNVEISAGRRSSIAAETFSMPIEIRIDGRLTRTFTAMITTETFAEVLVVKRDIGAHQRVTAVDVTVEKRRIDRAVANYVQTPEALRGKIAARQIKTGEVLMREALANGNVVKVGDRVEITAESEKVKYVMVGEARAAGKIGDKISVKNPSSGALLQGIITDEGKVRVSL